MVEEKQVPLQYLGKITAWPKGTLHDAMHDGSAQPLGAYHPTGWADEDLRIVKLEWRRIEPKSKRRAARGIRKP